MIGTDLAYQNLMITSKAPLHITPKQWNLHNRQVCRVSEDQEKLADQVIAESDRVIEETRQTTETWKKEVDYQLKERTTEIQFLLDELNRQKKIALLEEEAVKTYRTRVLNAIDTLKERSLLICQKCITLRDVRVGSDIVDDEVNRNLKHELKVIKGCQDLLNKVFSEMSEHLRRLKATINLLDRDLCNKDKSLQIDQSNLLLRENQLEMCIYEGKPSLDVCNSTKTEWEHSTHKNIENTAKELNSTIHLRSYVDILLKQVVEDLENQTSRTNESFEKRINELRYAKEVLQAVHNQTMNQINEITRNITRLEKELADKEGYIALTQMRQANRAHRPGIELVCDAVHDSLKKEREFLENTVKKLKEKISESQATLRYLLHTQMLQEEEINIKANSLKIDEVDCMTIREVLDYKSF